MRDVDKIRWLKCYNGSGATLPAYSLVTLSIGSFAKDNQQVWGVMPPTAVDAFYQNPHTCAALGPTPLPSGHYGLCTQDWPIRVRCLPDLWLGTYMGFGGPVAGSVTVGVGTAFRLLDYDTTDPTVATAWVVPRGPDDYSPDFIWCVAKDIELGHEEDIPWFDPSGDTLAANGFTVPSTTGNLRIPRDGIYLLQFACQVRSYHAEPDALIGILWRNVGTAFVTQLKIPKTNAFADFYYPRQHVSVHRVGEWHANAIIQPPWPVGDTVRVLYPTTSIVRLGNAPI